MRRHWQEVNVRGKKTLDQCFSNWNTDQNHLEGLLNILSRVLLHQKFWLVGLGEDLRCSFLRQRPSVQRPHWEAAALTQLPAVFRTSRVTVIHSPTGARWVRETVNEENINVETGFAWLGQPITRYVLGSVGLQASWWTSRGEPSWTVPSSNQWCTWEKSLSLSIPALRFPRSFLQRGNKSTSVTSLKSSGIHIHSHVLLVN